MASGRLVEGGVVTEGSAGSTAISLATVAPAYGCKCHVVIPDDAAIEKVCFNTIFVKHNYPQRTLLDILMILNAFSVTDN